jgi:hypothetical protein
MNKSLVRLGKGKLYLGSSFPWTVELEGNGLEYNVRDRKGDVIGRGEFWDLEVFLVWVAMLPPWSVKISDLTYGILIDKWGVPFVRNKTGGVNKKQTILLLKRRGYDVDEISKLTGFHNQKIHRVISD